GQYRDHLVVRRGRVIVEGFDAAEPPAGDLTDCIKDRGFEHIGTADRTDGAADAIPPIMAAQGALAPAIGRLQQIDDRIELLQRLVVAETGPVKRHSANPPPSFRPHVEGACTWTTFVRGRRFTPIAKNE